MSRLTMTSEASTSTSGLPVARTISQQAREFDLGAFKRCSIEGKFGMLIVGRASNVIVGAHRPRTGEPLRLWERLSVTLDGASRGGTS